MSDPHIINRDLLKQERVAVHAEGEMVVMQFGNTTIKTHYTSAFQISQMIRLHAKVAKRTAGDTSRHWSVLGILHDATKG